MIQLEGCIEFWEATLKSSAYLLESSTEVLIRETIKYLKELKATYDKIQSAPEA